MDRPSVIFCNLPHSGSSAIDPILRELLLKKKYFMTPYGPEGTSRLPEDLALGVVTGPFYHWTHDPVKTFEGMLGKPDYRFIYLHRDPRDAAVSWAHDFQMQGIFGNKGILHILKTVVTHVQPDFVRAAVDWINTDPLVITFEQVKNDIRSVLNNILAYIDYSSDKEINRDFSEQIEFLIREHSFERITGRERGKEGEVIRTGYLFRKGISGEWKKYFDNDLIYTCNQVIGEELAVLGYETVSHLDT